MTHTHFPRLFLDSPQGHFSITELRSFFLAASSTSCRAKHHEHHNFASPRPQGLGSIGRNPRVPGSDMKFLKDYEILTYKEKTDYHVGYQGPFIRSWYVCILYTLYTYTYVYVYIYMYEPTGTLRTWVSNSQTWITTQKLSFGSDMKYWNIMWNTKIMECCEMLNVCEVYCM